MRISPFTEADITDQYIGWLNDSTVMRFSNQRFRHHDMQSCRAYLRSFSGSSNLFVAIRLADQDALIGTMTAYLSEPHQTADMGLLIGDRSLWGQGLGLEAWSTLADHLMRERNVRKITGGAVRCNVGMVRIMERSGMHLEAVRERQEIVDGRAEDLLYFARFRRD